MKKLLAALDNSLAAKPVLTTALALGELLDARVEALHVPVDGDRVARSEAAAARVPFRTAPGPVVERLVEESRADDVCALAVGARGTPAGRRPLGQTALAVATSLDKPVVVVPPDAAGTGPIGRVLVPVEGGAPASPPRTLVELADGAALDVVVLHVHDEDSLPPFTDQPQHEEQAWEHEFLLRHCPWRIESVRLEVRVGRREDLVPLVADESRADMIVLEWAQELAHGHAPVVRAALARARIPVMLVPVHASPGPDAGREAATPIAM